MVLNFRLGPRRAVEPGHDTMGRSWNGYDPTSTAVEMWHQNRGRYLFNPAKAEAQQYATMSFDGWIVVVTRVTGSEPFADGDVIKHALVGDVLGPDDIGYQMLHGQAVPSGRGFLYLDDDEYGVTGAPASTTQTGTGTSIATQRQAQGWQSDPVRRKQVEDAAQDRLMVHYRDDGWDVVDTRYGNPYDAVAKRAGEVVYLEAKGTQTAGASVIVTSGEVEHARDHPGQCVMGVLSDIAFDQAGNVDPASGTFVMLPFAPQDEALRATGFTWQLP